MHISEAASEAGAPGARPEPDIEPRLLRAFLAVAREGHFGHAASRLRVAQPALSRQVQQLERLLGVELFARTSRGAELTAAGRLIVPEAERALAHNRRIVRTARSAATGRARVLTVSAPLPGPPGGLLSEAVRRFRGSVDDVGVSVIGLDDGEQTAALIDGRADAILTWDRPKRAELAAEVLVEERTSALLAQGHPWADEATMPLALLAEEQILFPLRERSHCWEQLSAAATAAGVGLTSVPTAPSAVPDLVAAGLGVSAVPDSFRFSRYPGVAFVPITGLTGRMSVVWRADDASAEVAGFVAACRAAAHGLAAAHADVWRLPREVRRSADAGRNNVRTVGVPPNRSELRATS
ncbi:LysR substrate-binding domain-containing protein [Streptomyces griseoviridis]|uniref:LysR family transcriptional regulator n=1 Tax=Streptomyces griseoviridis TaxID=45398 RepID=A0A918GSF9_STRGD|nr:LysR substrate-binding domain-containing protein [Streptomyces niveoruber]GGS55298.1 LysR family transcriptional regulator [Streptomyces niveoruber]